MFKIINLKNCTVKKWQGGYTRELYIYPPESSYEDRTFKFRISAAKVLKNKSIFTKLPNIERFLTLTKGTMILKFNGISEKKIKPYDIINFSGNDEIIACGTSEDFNLMFQNCKGKLFIKKIKKNNPFVFQKQTDYEFIFIYLIRDKKLIITDEKSISINKTIKIIYGYIKFDLYF